LIIVDKGRLHGTLSNPDNGQSVEIQWVQQNGTVTFETNGSSTKVFLELTGHLNLGYDTADRRERPHRPLRLDETHEGVWSGLSHAPRVLRRR
jgi:hypothetical protein